MLIGGTPAPACQIVARDIGSRDILTIEGLASQESDGRETLHPVQQAWLELQAPQCGWCTPGQILTAAALLERTPNPADDVIVDAMNGVLCRCGSYPRVLPAVRRAVAIAANGARS